MLAIHSNLDGSVGKLLLALSLLPRLESHDTTSPFPPVLIEFLCEVGVDGLDNRGKIALGRTRDFSEGKNRGSLHVNNCSKSSLALDNAVGHSHLFAESWQVDNELDWINIVSDNDQLGLLVLDQGDNVVESEFDVLRFRCLLRSGSVLGSLCDL